MIHMDQKAIPRSHADACFVVDCVAKLES